ncbi:serine protease 1-like [Pectinophora gossypiella]|uniref:serine protease 1-like n=1 Tax=Pectinophora gossypiella TaxID=13191 RepID=UPI00214E4DD3|nr:serine protease 1-like [Pectinophora gossypiella]
MRNNVNILAFLIIIIIGTACRDNLRVIHGIDDGGDSHGYVVAIALGLHYKAARFCTGSLIDTNWVITAAHCFATVKALGIDNCLILFENFTITPIYARYARKILQVIPHISYHKSINKNDIGLMLVEHVELNVFGKLSAVDYRTFTGRAVHYVGAGATYTDFDNEENPKLAKAISDLDDVRPLQIGEAVVVACGKASVRRLPDVSHKKNNALICLRSKCSNREERAQVGDSGGPLILDGKIIGIAHAFDDRNPYDFYYTAKRTGGEPVKECGGVASPMDREEVTSV